MLDFLGTIATAALMVFIVASLLVFADMSRRAKLIVAGLLGLWIGLASAAGAAGWLANARPFPVMGLFVAAPLLAAAIAASQPAARTLRKARCTSARLPTLNEICCTIGVSRSVLRPGTRTT